MSKMKDDSSSSNIGQYKINQTIGKGTFGKVKLGIFLPTNCKVAIKILEKSKMVDSDDKERAIREMRIMKTVNHQNVIKVNDIIQSNDKYYIIMEYCESGELFNLIVKKRRLSEDEASFFFYQLIQGLEYIHSLGIAHRDLKPENLLLSKNKTLKIIDFGLSNYFDTNPLSTPCGSPCYASPEMVSGNKYNGFKIDIWASGIILYAMLCGYLPFEDKDNEILFKKILRCKLEFPSDLSSIGKDMIRRILVTDPEKRITIKGIKKHQLYVKGEKIYKEKFNIKEKEIEEDLKGYFSNRGIKEEEGSNIQYSPLNTEVYNKNEIDRKINAYMNRKNEIDGNKIKKNKEEENDNENDNEKDNENNNENNNNENNNNENNNNENNNNENNNNDSNKKKKKDEKIEKKIQYRVTSQPIKQRDDAKKKQVINVNPVPKISKIKHLDIHNILTLNSKRVYQNSPNSNNTRRLNTLSSPNRVYQQHIRPITIKNAVINLNMIKPKFYFSTNNKKDFNHKKKQRTKSSSIKPKTVNIKRSGNLTLLNSLIQSKLNKEVKKKDHIFSFHQHYLTNICHTEDSRASKEKSNANSNKSKKNQKVEQFCYEYLQTEVSKTNYRKKEEVQQDKIRKQLSVNVSNKKRRHMITNGNQFESKQRKKNSDVERTLRTIREKMKQFI